MDDFEFRRKMNQLKKDAYWEYRKERQQSTQEEKPMERRKLKIRALLMGLLASVVTAIVYAIIVILPLALIMKALGTPDYAIMRRLSSSVIGFIAFGIGILIVNFVSGYVIAFFAKHAPYYNITAFYLVSPILISVIWLLAVLLNAYRPGIDLGLWDIVKWMFSVGVAYIGGACVKTY